VNTNNKEPYIVLKDISKNFGKFPALKRVSLLIHEGDIAGLIGPNGSGKSTLLKILAGIYKPDNGIGYIGKQQIGKAPICCGLMLENQPFIETLSGFENLKLLAGISGKATRDEIIQVIEYVGLNPADKRAVRKYSLGMRQRLGFAQAIMEKEKLLLLDEPTNGLDPKAAYEFRSSVLEQASRGVTVIVSSHSLSQISKICNKIFIIMEGSLTEVTQDERRINTLEEIYLHHAK